MLQDIVHESVAIYTPDYLCRLFFDDCKQTAKYVGPTGVWHLNVDRPKSGFHRKRGVTLRKYLIHPFPLQSCQTIRRHKAIFAYRLSLRLTGCLGSIDDAKHVDSTIAYS